MKHIFYFLALIFIVGCQQDSALAEGTFEIDEQLMLTTVSSKSLTGMEGIDAEKEYKMFLKRDPDASQSLYIVEMSLLQERKIEAGKDYQLTGIGRSMGKGSGSKYVKVESVSGIIAPK